MRKIKWFFKLGLLSILINLISCKSLDYAECTKAHQQELVVRWGEIFIKDNKRIGFELNSKAELFNYEQIANSSPKISKLGNANQESYCNILSGITKTILKTQIVNEIGDTLRYFEYINPEKSSNLFVKWHPRFNTKNSRGFQEVYDSLNSLKSTIK